MSDKTATTAVPIDALIARRWSPRAFDTTKNVDEKTLLALLEAARWAPSCFGDEPWRFVVCNRGQDEAAWEKMLSCLAEKNQLWAKQAPVLMLVGSMPTFSHNGSDNRWSQYDTGAASENVCLQAASMGLNAHQMGGFDVEQARAAFGIPDEVALMAVIAVGYHGAADTLHEDFQEMENATRKRKPLGDGFFTGQWGRPVSS
ncbi:MAG: nitroreductase family protein [Gammaproteobacteria bacterium]|nr:nitroreductase family protein [Gammaproteobacteria bacterium]